jgi:hypothetical protein
MHISVSLFQEFLEDHVAKKKEGDLTRKHPNNINACSVYYYQTHQSENTLNKT